MRISKHFVHFNISTCRTPSSAVEPHRQPSADTIWDMISTKVWTVLGGVFGGEETPDSSAPRLPRNPRNNRDNFDMQLKQPESAGGALADQLTAPDATKTPRVEFTKQSSSLPFGQPVPLSSISGPTYVTGQLLVQQIAYALSDKIFSYSPETFDLDVAVKDWAKSEEKNIHGYPTSVLPLQTRSGAGALALGYIFSKDFDLNKRHIPQTLLAPSLSLRHLRAALDQLALLYGVASPFVAHIAAADYSSDVGFVSEYGTALQLSEELGLGLVSSISTYESQHMSLFATLMAKVLPTLHIYDGVRTSRETLRVIDVLSQVGIADIFNRVSKTADGLNKRLDNAGRVLELLQALNDELGTDYEPFEYAGHEAAETVFVVFGSVESQLAKQVVSKLATDGAKIGVVSVRVYRPFVEEAFIKALPVSVRNVAVLGQVANDAAVTDASIQSVLYSDVLTAVSFSTKWPATPAVTDIKYPVSQIFTPSSFAIALAQSASKTTGASIQLPQLESVEQYIFWDVDDSTTRFAPTVVGGLLSRDSTSNVYLNESHDNLVQGGVVRTDLKTSKKTIDAPYPIETASVVVVADEKLLKEVAVSRSVKAGGSLVLRLPSFKEEDVEKRLSPAVRKDIQARNISLYVLDSALSPALEADAHATRLLVELAFLKVSTLDARPEVREKFSALESDPILLAECIDALEKCLKKIEVPASWAEAVEDDAQTLPQTLKTNSFVAFDKQEAEQDLQLSDWQAAAKGLVFKEACSTDISLRPDLTVKTYTIRVKENRRLTPATYDRNIFHIEFDLGDSGLTYKIGEALGIHAENDPELVNEFIESYGLAADGLVRVPSRENPDIVETRTVYQSLIQNIDIFGKPPKRFYEGLAEFATDELEKKKLAALGTQEGAEEFKRRSEVDFSTFADILDEFKSARPSFPDLARLVGPLKRREYSIASAQAVTPNAVALMIVVVDWVDSKGRTRYGQATRYLSRLPVGASVTASVKPSVMKLPTRDDAPLIMAGLGTGLAPFRAFVQYRAMQKAQGKEIGAILLYLGSRHQREEYLYGEEWEAYLDAGVVTLLGAAFSRDQPQKIYIQDRMRQTMTDIIKAYIHQEGSFYLCGPTWPVPDVTDVLMEAIATEAKASGKKVDAKKEIDRLKEDGRYVLEVY
ncbi:sulfite reductase flavoprotein component [Biscogniauxia mediterranea]|nr:sulfite reductase flavoprotein component [Biscogniauxia mediterranea]